MQKPSVTEILNEWMLIDGWYHNIYSGQKIPQGVFEDAGDFGRGVHKGAFYIAQEKEFHYPDELKHAFDELKRWFKVEARATVHFEMLGYSSKLDVAGTLDWIGHIERNKVLNLVDYKSTQIYPTVGPQTWTYEQIYREMTGYKGIIKRWVLYLPKKDGEYKFTELTDSIGDEHYFKSMNYGFRWRRR